MNDYDLPHMSQPPRPSLWNPNAAANWSLLFSPAFGAYLHAVNWRVLGKPERAAANMVWFWVTVVVLGLNLGTLLVPDSTAVEGVMRLAGLALLLGWYTTQGKSQARYVQEALPDGYDKKGWGRPLLAGVAAVGAYFVVIFAVAVVMYHPTPNDLADQIKPLILEEWHKKPELQDASIQNISLVDLGGNRYTGFVDATIGGQPERLSLEVVLSGTTIKWKVKPLTDPNAHKEIGIAPDPALKQVSRARWLYSS